MISQSVPSASQQTMSAWAPWQRMPPRYQLTMRDIDPYPDPPEPTPHRPPSASPRSPRMRTPRGGRRVLSARARMSGGGDDAGPMLTPGVSGGDEGEEGRSGPQTSVLPARESAYVSNRKNQLRMSAARRRLEDSGYTDTVPSGASSGMSRKPRAATAPAFPVTKAANTSRYHQETSPRPPPEQPSPASQQPRPTSGAQPSPRRRPLSGHSRPDRPVNGLERPATAGGGPRVAVSTLSPFSDPRDLRAEGRSLKPRPARSQQPCVIGEDQVAALYVDRGRVTFFRKVRPDVTQSVCSALSPYQVTRDDGSYLAHLRKAYLSGVRDLPKTARPQPDVDKHNTIRQRLDYDRKVGRILDYYSRVDVVKQTHGPRAPAPDHHPQPAPHRGFRPLSSRRKGPRATSVAASGPHFSQGLPAGFVSPRGVSLHLDPRGVSLQPDPRGEPDLGESLVRIHAQARLHDRCQFYLRTPAEGQGQGGPADRAAAGPDGDCACRMCHLEMELALVAQLETDLGAAVDPETAARIRASLENHHNNNSRSTAHPEQQKASPRGQTIFSPRRAQTRTVRNGQRVVAKASPAKGAATQASTQQAEGGLSVTLPQTGDASRPPTADVVTSEGSGQMVTVTGGGGTKTSVMAMTADGTVLTSQPCDVMGPGKSGKPLTSDVSTNTPLVADTADDDIEVTYGVANDAVDTTQVADGEQIATEVAADVSVERDATDDEENVPSEMTKADVGDGKAEVAEDSSVHADTADEPKAESDDGRDKTTGRAACHCGDAEH